jgi:hypothetical protein
VERKQLKNIITVVIKCSLEIHELFETKETEEGLDIRVKIGKYWAGGMAQAVVCPPSKHKALSSNPN